MDSKPLDGRGAPKCIRASILLTLLKLTLLLPTAHAELTCDGFKGLLGFISEVHLLTFSEQEHRNHYAAGLRFAVQELQHPQQLFRVRQLKELTTPDFSEAAVINCGDSQRVLNAFVDEGITGLTLADVLAYQLKGTLRSMDPHSDYHFGAELTQFEQSAKAGRFGFQFAFGQNFPQVRTVFPYGPADGKLEPGDLVISVKRLVDGKQINCGASSAQSIIAFFAGEIGDLYELQIERSGKRSVIQVELEERDGSLVDRTELLPGNIGYLRLIDFSEGAAKDVQRAVDSLIAQGARSLALDLRNNPGGRIIEAINIMDDFADLGVAVAFKTRSGEIEVETLQQPGRRTELPLAVMLNRFSASASELLAGGLEDFERAVNIGEVTFGKGTAQSLFPAESLQRYVHGSIDGMLRLTRYQYFTPSGDSPQRVGIEPHVVVMDVKLDAELKKQRAHYARMGYQLLTSESDYDNAIATGSVASLLKPEDFGGNNIPWITAQLESGLVPAAMREKDQQLVKTASYMQTYSDACLSYHRDHCEFGGQPRDATNLASIIRGDSALSSVDAL